MTSGSWIRVLTINDVGVVLCISCLSNSVEQRCCIVTFNKLQVNVYFYDLF